MATADAFLYTGDTRTAPPDAPALRRVAGVGSSPVVRYGGAGVYFLDRVRSGVWRLEVYPDAVPVRDPFEMPSPTRIVTRAISRAWSSPGPVRGPAYSARREAGRPGGEAAFTQRFPKRGSATATFVFPRKSSRLVTSSLDQLGCCWLRTLDFLS